MDDRESDAHRQMRREEDKELFKQAMKEAGKEWLTEQFAAFGKWSAIGIASGAFYLLVKFFVINGVWPR